jgi:hypothetical protein
MHRAAQYLLPSLVKPGCLPDLPIACTQIRKFGMCIIFLISLISTNTMLSSVHVIRWIVGSCRPLHIINDVALCELLTAGRPNIDLPSSSTIARDIKACLILCRERIGKLLREHPGRLHFGTDTWTSPNYHPFGAQGDYVCISARYHRIAGNKFFLVFLLNCLS